MYGDGNSYLRKQIRCRFYLVIILDIGSGFIF